MARVFLDIDIGDAEKHEAEVAGVAATFSAIWSHGGRGRLPPSALYFAHYPLFSFVSTLSTLDFARPRVAIYPEWQRAIAFLAGSGANYGLSGVTPSDLDDAGKELLLEVWMYVCARACVCVWCVCVCVCVCVCLCVSVSVCVCVPARSCCSRLRLYSAAAHGSEASQEHKNDVSVNTTDTAGVRQ